jgi:rod shape-determining protein MreB
LKPRGFASLRLLAPDLGIDLGSSHTVIATPGSGILLDEPTLVAIDRGTRRVIHRGQAVGHMARLMQGRTPDSIQLIRPIRYGTVSDFDICASMLREFLRKSNTGGWGRPRGLLAIPNRITPVERQALYRAAARAGVRQVSLISKSLAAGLAAGLPITEPVASMVCDLGAGCTDIAVLCLNDVAVSESLRVAGDDLDLAIVDYLRRKHRLCVGQHVSERVKIDSATAVSGGARTVEVGGRDLVSGLPRRVEVAGEELREAMQNELRSIVAGVQRVLESCPAEMAADLMENGMVLVGGGASLTGLDRLLSESTGMPVRVAEEPNTCVARGLALCLENLELWHGLIQGRGVA